MNEAVRLLADYYPALLAVAVFAGWLVMQLWILPKLGIGT